jgi:hypothetical protein
MHAIRAELVRVGRMEWQRGEGGVAGEVRSSVVEGMRKNFSSTAAPPVAGAAPDTNKQLVHLHHLSPFEFTSIGLQRSGT